MRSGMGGRRLAAPRDQIEARRHGSTRGCADRGFLPLVAVDPARFRGHGSGKIARGHRRGARRRLKVGGGRGRGTAAEGRRRAWDAEPVGLGLVDALAGDANNCLLSPHLRLKSYSSLPKDCGGDGYSHPELGKTMSCPALDAAAGGGMSVPSSRFFHGDLKSGPGATQSARAQVNAKRHSFDLGKLPGPGSLPASAAAGAWRFVGSVSASEIEQSEDYTRIIARGPNPKTTHIFGDCILEPLPVGESDEAAMEVQEGATESYWLVKCAAEATTAEYFLSSCFTCKKKVDGNDIYMYRTKC